MWKCKCWAFFWTLCSSGSSGRVRGEPRNMKSMWPPSAAIFFMTYFDKGRGPMAPSAPLDLLLLVVIPFSTYMHKCVQFLYLVNVCNSQQARKREWLVKRHYCFWKHLNQLILSNCSKKIWFLVIQELHIFSIKKPKIYLIGTFLINSKIIRINEGIGVLV